MEKTTSKGSNENYQPPQKALWTGRKSDPDDGTQYWYQAVTFQNANDPAERLQGVKGLHLGLLGYVCDEGVRRNFGRAGAKQTPALLRKQLAKMPFHPSSLQVTDFGDAICIGEDMEGCQKSFSEMISKLISKGILPIAIGGGHDIAYAHFSGIWQALNETPSNKVGIINFDAHFDLRPLEDRGNSGTPFYQILSEHKDQVAYFAIGIQQGGNTRKLFDIAKKHGVRYLTNYDCNTANLEAVKNKLATFIAGNDHIYVTIDMDGFSSSYAPGVSAPSPLGFTPDFFLEVLKFVFSSKKVISCDIAEVNPEYDRDNITVNLAARIVDFIALNQQ